MKPPPLERLHAISSLLRQAVPYAAALVLLLLLRQSRLSERINLQAYDLAVLLRPAPSGASTPVRLIGIDDQDLQRHGDPIPDGLLAEAIERLDQLGVRAIGLDLFRDQPAGRGSERLRRLAATNPRLVSAYYQPDGIAALPGTPWHRQGYADLYLDPPPDSMLRRDVLHIDHAPQRLEVSLPMRVLQVATGQQQLLRRLVREPAQLVDLQAGAGGYLPDAGVTHPAFQQRLLAFHQPGSFPSWSLSELLRQPLSAQDRRQLRGSLVLIGAVAPSKKDRFTVPFSLRRSNDQTYQLSGVEIHAHRLAALLALDADRPLGIRAASAGLNGALLLLAAAAGVLAGEAIPGLRRSQLVVGAGLLLAVATTALGLALGLWLDAALPIAAFALLATAAWIRRGTRQELQRGLLEKEGKLVRGLFDRFVSRQVAEALLAPQPPTEAAAVAPELRQATVLVSDLRGFSLLSEVYEPATLVRSLNLYLEAMFAVIEDHGGTIDNVIGDGLQVLFGVPHDRRDHAQAAVRCALAMQAAMEAVNRANAEQGLPLLEMGIGLCSGEVIATAIGSSLRAKYSVVGEAVNLASRIEALTLGGEVLAAQATVEVVEAPLRIDARYTVTPKGSRTPLQVCHIGAIAGDQPLALAEPERSCTALAPPLTIHYALLEGKQRQGPLWSGWISHVGRREIWLQPEQANLQLFDQLVLQWPKGRGEAYGKVRECRQGLVRVGVSGMGEEVRAWFQALGAS